METSLSLPLLARAVGRAVALVLVLWERVRSPAERRHCPRPWAIERADGLLKQGR